MQNSHYDNMNEAKLITESNAWRLCGRVASDNALALRAEGEHLLAGCGAGGVVNLDLSELEAADSAPVSLLLCWQRQATRTQITLKFTAISESLRALLELYGLSDLAEFAK